MARSAQQNFGVRPRPDPEVVYCINSTWFNREIRNISLIPISLAIACGASSLWLFQKLPLVYSCFFACLIMHCGVRPRPDPEVIHCINAAWFNREMRNISLIPISLAIACGASSLWLFQKLPLVPFALPLACLCFFVCLIIKDKFGFMAVLLAAIGGFIWCDHASQQVLQNRLPASLESVPLLVTGTIIGIPEGEAQNLHFDFLLTKISAQTSPANMRLPQKIRLSTFYRGDPKKNPLQNIRVGETWQFSVKLKQARSTFNPESFDYEGWLFAHRFSATGYIIEKGVHQKLSESFWHSPMSQWRERIETQLEQSLANNPNLGLIEALAIGVRDQLNATQWQVMQATGTNHLVAIAGLHVGFVVAFMYFVINFIWRRTPVLMLYLPAKEASAIFSLIAAFYYSALAGFALPTQRALVMLTVGLLATLFRRNISAWHAIATALTAVILYDPLCVFSDSFWLSFVAVGMILYCVTGRLGSNHHWQQSLHIQWVIAIGLAPITLYFFHQMSLINLLANGIAIPWVAFLGLPLILLGVLIAPISNTGAAKLWWLAAKALAFYWPSLSLLASLDRLQWHTYIPNFFIFLLAMISMLIFLAPKGWPYRFLGLLGFLPLLYPQTENIAEKNFKITQLDVGQGLSSLIQTAHHTMIFDTGLRLDENYDMGKSVVIPALESRQIHSLDLLVISHGDNDHSGGSWAVLQALPVKNLLTSIPSLYANVSAVLPDHLINEPFLTALQQHWPKPNIIACESGQHWTWDGVNFEVLSPDHDYYPRKTNDRSCVIRISNGIHSVLLTGDIEKRTEVKILTEYAQKLPADLIIAPHHGSKTSSSENFIKAIHPAWVFYATGYRNRFHFPNDEVVERYQSLATQSADTAKDGQILMNIPNQAGNLNIIRTRKIQKHFWNF